MSRDELGSEIYRACDIMRRDNNCGGVMEYVEHLSWLLFLKFLDEREDVFEAEAALDGREYQRMIPDEYRWSSWVTKSLGERTKNGHRSEPAWDGTRLIQFVRGELIPLLASLSGSPEKDVIAGVFSDRNVIVCASPFNLKDVLQVLDDIDFNNPDDIHTVSHVYESLLRRLGNENRLAGEFYTPRPVIRFCVEVIDPVLGETIYDPAAGSCGFLAESYLHMRAQELTTDHRVILQSHTFVGQEKKPVPALLGLINMVVHGISTPEIRRRNTLEEDIRVVSERFDVVLTNPPFGGTENSIIQRNFPIRSTATELLFIQHIMRKLKSANGARCGMVVPEGTLFRGGPFVDVKAELLEQFNLSFVVSLPPGTFSPYADVKTALLFFSRPGPTKEVLYHEVPLPPGLKKFSKGSPIRPDDFSEALSVWTAWKAFLDGEAPRPELPISTWVEPIQNLVEERECDLTAQNPNRPDKGDALIPSDVTSQLVGQVEELSRLISELDGLVREEDE